MMVHLNNAEGQRVRRETLTAFSCNMTPDPTTGLPANCFALSRESVLGPSASSSLRTDGPATGSNNVFAAGPVDRDLRHRGSPLPACDGWHAPRPDRLCGNTRRPAPASPMATRELPDNQPLHRRRCHEHHFTGKERDTESGNDYSLPATTGRAWEDS